MRRWQSYYDILFFPLLTIFAATVVMGLTGLILNGSFQTLTQIDNQMIIKTAEITRYLCGFLIANSPLLIMINLLSRKYDDITPVFIGVIGYIIFHITTMFFASSTLPRNVFAPVMGISIDVSQFSITGSGLRYPLITGMLAVAIVTYITRSTYRISRKRSTYGYLAFINRKAWALLITGFFTFVAGMLIAFVWPYLVSVIYYIFKIIANDITNPMNLFLYGILDRVMEITGSSSIIRNLFWFGEYGGSWIGNNINYLGDVSIYTAQQAAQVFNTGFGRLITPYYVLNMFAVPAILIATFSTFTDKIEKKKYTLFLGLAVLFSIVTGSLLPIEIYLLIMTPLLYVSHLFFTGILFALLAALDVTIGYAYSGPVFMATPGSAIDLLTHIRDVSFYSPFIKLMIVGVVVFVIYYVITRYYYKKACLDILNTGSKLKYVNNFILAIGGINNIKRIYSTPTKVILQVADPKLLNFNLMKKQGASKVVETRTTFDISYGAISYLLVSEVNKLLKEAN